MHCTLHLHIELHVCMCSSVLNLMHAWSRESRIRAVKLVSKALAVILVLSLIIFFCLRYLSLCSWRSMETMQWSDMYLCVVAFITLTSPCSCVKMKPSVFPSLCVWLCMCCSSLRAATVLLNMVSSALVVSVVLMLKSPSMIMLLRLGILSVRRLVISSTKVEVVIWLLVLGGGGIGQWCGKVCFCGWVWRSSIPLSIL